MQVAEVVSQLMPNGKPDLLATRNYPAIEKLKEQYGGKHVRTMIFLLVKNFCESFNVVRNMTEDQMIDAASYLFDECGNYRLEDYLLMFNMAKRGLIGKVLDRIDISVIAQIHTEFDAKRFVEGERAFEQFEGRNEQARWQSGDSLSSDEPEEVKKGRFMEIMRRFKEKCEEAQKERDEQWQNEIDRLQKKKQEQLDRIMQEREKLGVKDGVPIFDFSEFIPGKNNSPK